MSLYWAVLISACAAISGLIATISAFDIWSSFGFSYFSPYGPVYAGPKEPVLDPDQISNLLENQQQKGHIAASYGSGNVIVDISVRFCATLSAIDFGLNRRAPGDWTLEDSNPRLSL